jgi:hypothetical protein
LESSECYPPSLKPDSQANFQALNAQLGDNCSAPILEPERSALIQEALADSQLQAVKAQLERRGLGMNADEAQAVQLVGGEQLLIPFGQDAHLVWTRTNGQTAAIGLVRQGNKTLNVGADGQERVVRVLSAQQAEKLVRKLREKSKFQEFEGKLAQKGKRVGKVRVLLDETNKIAIVGIAAEGDEKIAHQVRIKVKADKDDEPEDDAEPMIQATACGQATGEAVPTGARMQPLMLDAGEGGDVTTGSYTLIEGDYGPEICTSQWGYDYLCTSTTPMLRLSLSRLAPTLALPPTFINQQVQASFTIWNGGGGTLAGTVSAQAPFSIVSGASFSLLPGQPQEVVVRFSSATAGSFSKSIAISSNGGNATVTATSVAHKVSFSPAVVDFGSGFLMITEQCYLQRPRDTILEPLVINQDIDTVVCRPRTEKVGLPIEKTLTVKNEGTVAITLTLSTGAPYKVVSVLPTLSPGQSAQVTLRFDPAESGSFTGTVQVGINGGQGSVSASLLVGVVHKVSINPRVLDFNIVLLGSTKRGTLTIQNEGTTIMQLDITANPPFRIASSSSFALPPGTSKQVNVEISPTVSRTYIEKIQLTSNLARLEVPVTAAAITREEYLEYLQRSLAVRNVAARQFDIVDIVENGLSSCLHVFGGFRELTLEQIEGWINSINCQDISEIDPARLKQIGQAFKILERIGAQQVSQWLQALKQALTEGRFEEEFQSLLSQGLAQLMDALQLLLDTNDLMTAKDWLRGFVATLDQEQYPDPLAYANMLQNLVRQNYISLYGENSDAIAAFNLVDQYWDQLVARVMTLSSVLEERYRVSNALFWITMSMAGGPWDIARAMDQLAGFLGWMNSEPRIMNGIGTILSAGHAASQGWRVQGFMPVTTGEIDNWAAIMSLTSQRAMEIGAWSPRTVVGPNNQPYNIDSIHAVVIGSHCQQCNALTIYEWIISAMKSYGENLVTSGRPNELNLYVFAFTRDNPQGVEGIVSFLASRFQNTFAVVMIVWTKDGQVKWACVSAGCQYLSPREQQAIAQSFANLLSKYPAYAVYSAGMFCSGDIECMERLLESLWGDPEEEEECSGVCPQSYSLSS